MLPLHSTFRNLFSVSFSLIILFASCSDRSKNDLEVIKALDESLVNSNKVFMVSTIDIINALQDKLHDRRTSERAQVWYPKAQLIQKISKEAIDQIERIKKDIKKIDRKKMLEDDSLGLYQMLVGYKKSLLEIDPQLKNNFKKPLKIFTKDIDSSNENQIGLLKRYFIGVSIPAARAMLTKIQNNIRINEEGMTMYCFEQCGRIVFGPCIIDFPIAIINSTVVQPEEKIEVTAGVGSFYTNYNSQVFIYGKTVTIKDEGVASYKFKAESKPGKYYVPVKINYTDQNGIKQSIQKEIEYTVANFQKQ